MIRWWKQRRMRWAVREHRRIHRDGWLITPCRQRLMLKRANRMFNRQLADTLAALGEQGMQGATIIWPKLEPRERGEE